MYFPCCVSCVAAAEAQCRNEGQRTSYTGVAARFIFMWKHSQLQLWFKLGTRLWCTLAACRKVIVCGGCGFGLSWWPVWAGSVLLQAPKLCVMFECEVMRWWLLRHRLVRKSKLAPAPIPLCGSKVPPLSGHWNNWVRKKTPEEGAWLFFKFRSGEWSVTNCYTEMHSVVATEADDDDSGAGRWMVRLLVGICFSQACNW